MKTIFLTLTMIISANSYAGTFKVNPQCESKVAELSKALVKGFLSSDASITSAQVDTTVPQSDDMAPSFIETQVQVVIEGESDTISTKTKVFVTSDSCAVMSSEIIEE